MKIILFVDDLRDVPQSVGCYYQPARTLEKAKQLLRNVDYTDISLDYALGKGDTTLDLLKYIKEEGIVGIQRINIHTDNPEKYKLVNYIEENFKNIQITFNEYHNRK